MPVKYVCFLLGLLLTSCGASRNLVYFSDLESKTQAPIENEVAPRIKSKDLLSITVSSLDPESNVLFNTGMLLPAGMPTNAVVAEKANEGFLVNREGDIILPMLGRVRVGGLTIEEATEMLTELSSAHVKNPIVKVRFQNFAVTILGEVNNPSTFTVADESINILEALALAGDMTVFGKRENVVLIREVNGERTTTRINLNDKGVLNSPYFYLQQNDIVYVEPHNRSKLAQSSPFNRYIPVIVTSISAIATFVAVYITAVNR